MGVDPSSSARRRRRLAPSEKYQLYLQVLTGQATQREAAERWKVDRSTVVHICRVAKQGALDALAASVPGRPGQTGEQAATAAAREEIERLRATVTEQAVVIHLAEGKHVGTERRPGPVPSGRVRQGRPAGSRGPRRGRRLVAAAGGGQARYRRLPAGPLAAPAVMRGADRPGPGRRGAARPAACRTGRDPGVVSGVG